jgi:hypothetical protein
MRAKKTPGIPTVARLEPLPIGTGQHLAAHQIPARRIQQMNGSPCAPPSVRNQPLRYVPERRERESEAAHENAFTGSPRV